MQEEKEDRAIKLLERYSQEHVIEELRKKVGKEKEILIDQILSIPFEKVIEL